MSNFGCVFLFAAVIINFCNADGEVVACHTSDYVCFKRQYRALRDRLLLDRGFLPLPAYAPHAFHYGGTGTCVRVSGFEDSELVGIRMNSEKRLLTLVWDLPLKIEQVMNTTLACVQPEHDLGVVEPFKDELHKFSGNASIEVIYPYEIRVKKEKHHLLLLEEKIDVLMNVPDLSDDPDFDVKEFEDSEWAFGAVQSWDAAQHLAAPFTDRYRAFAARVPLESYLLLYPEESYEKIEFAYDDDTYKTQCVNLFHDTY